MIHLEYIGCNYLEDTHMTINRPKGSNDYLFLLFHTHIYQRHNNELHHLMPGSMILYTPDYPQYYHNHDMGFDNDWFHFVISDRDTSIDQLNIPLNTPFFLNDVTFIHNAIKDIEKEHLMKNQDAPLMINALIIQLFVQIQRMLSHQQELEISPLSKEVTQQFRHFRSSVLSQMDYPWTLNKMAELSNLSRSRFCFLYKAIFGISPKEDLRKERIKMAKYLLTHTNQPVSEISRKVGYEDIYQFSKYFKKSTTLSPLAYRKGHATTLLNH